jgi:hypothetical protein
VGYLIRVAAWNRGGCAAPQMELAARNRSIEALRESSGWSAGRRIVEEELLVDRYEEWLDVSRRDKGTTLCYRSRCRRSAELRRLANLAGRFVLSLGVRMRQRLGHK